MASVVSDGETLISDHRCHAPLRLPYDTSMLLQIVAGFQTPFSSSAVDEPLIHPEIRHEYKSDPETTSISSYTIWPPELRLSKLIVSCRTQSIIDVRANRSTLRSSIQVFRRMSSFHQRMYWICKHIDSLSFVTEPRELSDFNGFRYMNQCLGVAMIIYAVGHGTNNHDSAQSITLSMEAVVIDDAMPFYRGRMNKPAQVSTFRICAAEVS
ncbi:hypothetical protein AKJ16_DCAP08048 [Drosera capensis]